MSKKISAEIRHQVLLLLRQGARAQSIATQLRLTKSWVQQCQYRFDLGDLTWLDPTYRSLVTPELALRAVREYEICRNYAQRPHASATFHVLMFTAMSKIWQSGEYRCYPVDGRLRRRSLP